MTLRRMPLIEPPNVTIIFSAVFYIFETVMLIVYVSPGWGRVNAILRNAILRNAILMSITLMNVISHC
jgi:hypothetical protein